MFKIEQVKSAKSQKENWTKLKPKALNYNSEKNDVCDVRWYDDMVEGELDSLEAFAKSMGSDSEDSGVDEY